MNQVNFLTTSTSDFVRYATAAGASGVEMHPLDTNEPIDTVVRAVRNSALEVVSVNPLPNWFEQEPAAVKQVTDLVEAGAALGATYLGVPSPIRIPGETVPRLADIAERLSELHEAAIGAGLEIAFEPVGRSVKRANGFGVVSTVERALELMDLAGIPAVLVIDSFCLGTAGVDLSSFQIHGYRTAVVHVADRSPSQYRVFPGEGNLDLSGFFRWLGNHRYTGPISMEVFPLPGECDPQGLASRCVRYLNELSEASRDPRIG